MKRYIDISEFINEETVQSVLEKTRTNLIKRRKELKLSRKALSLKSNVSYGVIRHFEETGKISLMSLLKIAQAINSLQEFSLIFSTKKVKSLKDEWEK